MKKRILVALLVLSMLTGLFSFQCLGESSSNLKFGAWLGTQPSRSVINSFQELQGKKLDIVHQFIDWSTDFSWVKSYADAVYDNGSILMITWEPWEYNTVAIKNGNADAYIAQMARDMKAYGKEIWLRPLHEANGNWYPWAIGYPGNINTNETYIAAFRRIVDIFRQNGATNVKWIYTVNCDNVGDGTSYMGYYPGDNYVDYAAIDGYNWGTTQDWGSRWQSFDEIFSRAYNALLATNKPILIAEFASTEIGGNKARWITEAYNTIKTSYKKIFAAVWFHENKETDWRINSSSEALVAYKNAIGADSSNSTPTSTPTPTPIPTSTSSRVVDPFEMVAKMGMGINLGNTLEAPYEGSWSKEAMEYYFDDYKDAGYKNVRIPIRWDNHTMNTYPYTIDKNFLDRVEKVVDWSLSRGFVTVINSHHDDWIKENYNGNIERFESIWEQISERFKNKSANLLFEIMNEPFGNITDSQIDDMNSRILKIIRKTNPTRIVIIGGGHWNSYNTLVNIKIPNDPYLIGTFHYYEPYEFTHKWEGTWGTQGDMDAVVRVFDYVKRWSEQNNIPVYLGEFAVMAFADRPSRLKWLDFISDQALDHGFACTVWDNGVFGSLNDDMGIYNRMARTFEPEVLNAIMNEGVYYTYTPQPTQTPKPSKPPVTPAVGEEMFDDFEGVLMWGSYYGESANASSRITTGKSGKGLEITYTGATDGYWGAACNLTDGDWSKWLKISFDIKSLDPSNNEIRFMITEQSEAGEGDGEHWIYSITPKSSWETIEIPFDSFKKRPDYQPPGQDMSNTLDLDKICAIHFTYANGYSGKILVDNIKLIGITSDITPTPTPSIKLGDVNFDNEVNSTDLTLLKRYILKTLKFNTSTEEEMFKKAADLNEDNSVDSSDITLLKRYILRKYPYNN
ncbi:MAG: cellulase family glycosylhydrolase [Clostridium sp.]|jgi:endoglucanase|nr:cellulase family glycosylhydrolase [Clostridium sp.]